MAKSRLFIWSDKQKCSKTNAITQDVTVILMCIFIMIFMAYGVTSTILMDYIEACLTSTDIALLLVNIMIEVIKVVLYVLLAIGIRFAGWFIWYVAWLKNGKKYVFMGHQIRRIMQWAMIVTAIFWGAYVLTDATDLYGYIAVPFASFVVNFFIPVGNFSSSKNKDANKENNNDMRLAPVLGCCFIAIPFSIFLDYLSNYFIFRYSIVWIIFLLLMVAFGVINSYDRKTVTKKILELQKGKNVLIYGQVAYSTVLQNKIFRAIKKQYKEAKKVSKWIDGQTYDTIIIVEPFDSESKRRFVLEIAGAVLAPGGVIIAPAYTSTKKDSNLLSLEEYKAEWINLGFEIKNEFSSKFKKISCVELVKVQKPDK